ncbi:MAG: phosphotransferase [Desulfobacterales bacterium]|nr:phosphotransferase [Desulfobacterales bacterium]
MKNIKYRKYNSYYFGYRDIEDDEFAKIVEKLEHDSLSSSEVLSGRGAVTNIDLYSGSVVIKSYKRGGLLRHFNKETYIRTGIARNESEFNSLITASEIGINVPKPVAFIRKGSLFCRYWLIIEEIKNHQSLTKISNNDEKRTRSLMKNLMVQVGKLVENNFYHVDLHPGNILVDSSDNVYIIDFDKAHKTMLNQNALTEKYTERWIRAVKKYNLSKILIEKFRITNDKI